MSSASTENRSLWKEILIATRIIFKANSGHFHALSILFLFPIFFSLVVYPSFHLSLFHPDYDFITQPQLSNFFFSSFEIVVLVAYTLFLVLIFLCSVATITYSAVHASYDRPINFVSSIKSIRNSFFPLLFTFIVSHAVFISIALIFALSFVFIVQILQTLGFTELKYDSNHFLFLLIPALIVLVPILIWLQVNWSLAYVITVVESKWGFETLRKSAYLVKGKRWIILSRVIFFGLVLFGLIGGGSMFLVIVSAAKGHQWRSLGVILQTAQCSVMGYLVMSQFLVGNVVLYMYCKDLNGEKLPLEIRDKFAGEYVSLPLDEEKNHATV
ncbi:uncharacterized protein LOC107774872 [Nicotiana tabacum]|uniref:Uncharacterized protein LOC107774872 n=1 Tax=Nicotiana tabacum TaxID=4097 RepID=A0A1S3YDE2_TOBAC|nr:uncharacterized protein LOC104093406 [Nicotiana tomentosiformis]XP_016450013.1 PREDICTED: uncharacterized protein LOC107774872 [Nicotiana tabacum]